MKGKVMSKKNLNLLLITITLLITHQVHSAEALLIGVSSYPQSPLANPVNDVQLISKALTTKGWNSRTLINPTSEQLKDSVRSFYQRTITSNEPSLIYFSGHGIQYRGENYLLPIDISEPKSILKKAISITEIGYFSKDNKGPKIFIVDACRSSPLGKESISVSSGLNSQYAPPNSLIAYATSPGEVALDGVAGSNSPYAKAFANSVERYNSLDEIFKKTRMLTMMATNGKQLPWESSSLYQEVNFSNNRIENKPSQQNQQVTNASLIDNNVVNNGQYIRPSMPENKYESIVSALDSLRIIIEKSSLSSFEKRNGNQIEERDKQDFLATIEAEKLRYKTNPSGVAYALITSLQSGVFYPKCRKGSGIDASCGDYDRYFKFTPNLKLSLELSKIAHNEKIRSDKLAIHYMNGWGVDKDLVKAYELFESDKNKGGVVAEYWWTNINTMVQSEMKKMGFNVGIDGDFGSSSCKALTEIIGNTRCARVVTKEQLIALISKNKTYIE